MNYTGNGANQGNSATPPNNFPPLESPYGYRRFNNNQEAHTFVNTILNRGNGYTGAVATVRNLTVRGSPREGQQGPPLNDSLSNLLSREPASAIVERFPRGSDNGLQVGRHVSVHGRRDMQMALGRTVPMPSSALLMIANIDTPIRTEDLDLNRDRYNYSPASSISSVNSCGSVSSVASSACTCSYCRGCVCHLYCAHHARIKCPVHGQGITSSDDSGFGSFGSSQSSTHSGSSVRSQDFPF